MKVDGFQLDLSGLQILPGLINSHDHLEFALFPKLGRRKYSNAAEWARDIYRPDTPPISDHLKVPKPVRLQWGGLRNLIAGVTTVCHHNPYHSAFDDDFPVRVVKRYGWAHSFAFEADVCGRFRNTPANAPFIMHAAEGTDADSADEIRRLNALALLTEDTVLVHGTASRPEGRELIRRHGSSVVICPRSNAFTLDAIPAPEMVVDGIPVALGTDSPLTADGDMLDEIAFTRRMYSLSDEQLIDMVTTRAAAMLRLEQNDDWIGVPSFGAPPELIVISGQVRLISTELAFRSSVRPGPAFSRLHVEGRPPAYVRAPVYSLLQKTRQSLGTADIFLAGRRILS